RAGLFNIGAEGQLLVGGITAAWVGTWAFMADVPGIVAVPVIILAGAAGGFFWGGIPGVLRARTGAHEVISTIMLNSIALFMVRWIVNSRDPVILRDLDASVPRTTAIADSARLPELADSQPNLHAGLFVMIGLCIVVAFVLRRTTFGFETITVGTNPHAAHYAGISVNRIIILAMALSGSFAGVAAASEVAGTNSFFQPGTFAFIGFDGIAIALLARANPIAIIPASFLWGALLSGAPLMQAEAGVSIDVVRIIQSMVLLFVAADAIVRYLFRIRAEGGHHIEAAATGWVGS
ncbi:MAG: ABC transporter permease, partial [Acidimicrobiia bacterium]|nr:ABC transporter permease [Acidimicrobiia bacterium]